MQHSCARGLSSLIGKKRLMSSILSIVILLILWAIGYFVYDLGTVVHILLALALITIVMRIIQGRKMKIKLRGKYF